MVLFWLLLAAAVFCAIEVYCYRTAFYSDRSKDPDPEAYNIPDGEIYEPFRDQMVGWIKEVRAMPHEEMSITSFDGLTLRGKYYEFSPEAPVELMFHGYRGAADRDLCGGVQRCFALGHSALIVDQRGCGRSEGNMITFGIKEHKDCLTWLEEAIRHFGPDVKIILTGISMGAATVMMAAGRELPKNVIGVLADCGYSSAREIIQVVIRQMHLPPKPVYPFVKLAAKLIGGFDLEETSPMEAMKNCRVPVIFFHGETDDFVPCDMSRALYEACAARKKLVTIPNAGHGLSYPVAPETYLDAMREFFGDER